MLRSTDLLAPDVAAKAIPANNASQTSPARATNASVNQWSIGPHRGRLGDFYRWTRHDLGFASAAGRGGLLGAPG
jgi:hypothetical protein